MSAKYIMPLQTLTLSFDDDLIHHVSHVKHHNGENAIFTMITILLIKIKPRCSLRQGPPTHVCHAIEPLRLTSPQNMTHMVWLYNHKDLHRPD